MTDPTPRAVSGAKVWLAVAWLIGYGIFFFSFTLPNDPGKRTRTDIWLDLPVYLWANIVTPPEMRSPSSWANLSQRLDLIAVAAAIWLGSWAVGQLILRLLRLPLAPRCVERCVLACGVGASVVSLLTLGCGLLGWMSSWPMGGVLAVAFVAELALRWRSRPVAEVVRLQGDGHPIPPNSHEFGYKSGRMRRWLHAVNGVLFRGEQIPYGLMAKSLAVIAMALFLMAMLLGSLLPPTDFDVKAYHLTGPKEYFQSGRITFLEHNVYTNFPFLTEMLCLLGMMLRQDWFRGALAGQAVLMGFAPLTGLALFCAGRRWFGVNVGWLAATIYLSTPWTYRLAIIAYVEGALSCYLFLTLFTVLLACSPTPCGSEDSMTRANPPTHKGSNYSLFIVAGLLAGSAMACKYPGLVSVVIPLFLASVVARWRCQVGERGGVSPPVGTMATENRGADAAPLACAPIGSQVRATMVFKTAMAFGIGVAITIGPWLLKNLVETGNPVYPLAYGLFGGRDWDAASHAKWRAGHSPASFAIVHGGDPWHRTLAQYFIDVTAMADWLSPLLFGLAVFAVGRNANCKLQIANCKSDISNLKSQISNCQLGSSAMVRWLWLYVGYLFLQWWLLTHRIDRFWVPLIPVVALLAGVGCTWSENKIWVRSCSVFVGLSVLFNLGFITTPLCGFSAYLSDLNESRRGCESTAGGIQYLNQLHDAGKLGPKPVVLCVGEAQVFDSRMPVIYNTVFDQPIFRDWLASRPAGEVPDRDWPLRPVDEIRRKFAEAGVTHVLVNWQELLRYRTTYGYSDFVTPARFAWLRENGVLGDPARFIHGVASYESLDKSNCDELDRWASELKRKQEGHAVYLSWQLFDVR